MNALGGIAIFEIKSKSLEDIFREIICLFFN